MSLSLSPSLPLCVSLCPPNPTLHSLLLLLLPPPFPIPSSVSVSARVGHSTWNAKHTQYEEATPNVLVHIHVLIAFTLRLSNEELKHNSVLLIVAGTGIVVAAQVSCLPYIEDRVPHTSLDLFAPATARAAAHRLETLR